MQATRGRMALSPFQRTMRMKCDTLCYICNIHQKLSLHSGNCFIQIVVVALNHIYTCIITMQVLAMEGGVTCHKTRVGDVHRTPQKGLEM